VLNERSERIAVNQRHTIEPVRDFVTTISRMSVEKIG
jgi:hypothetical protein